MTKMIKASDIVRWILILGNWIRKKQPQKIVRAEMVRNPESTRANDPLTNAHPIANRASGASIAMYRFISLSLFSILTGDEAGKSVLIEVSEGSSEVGDRCRYKPTFVIIR
jgi:hypothetical protein